MCATSSVVRTLMMDRESMMSLGMAMNVLYRLLLSPKAIRKQLGGT